MKHVELHEAILDGVIRILMTTAALNNWTIKEDGFAYIRQESCAADGDNDLISV